MICDIDKITLKDNQAWLTITKDGYVGTLHVTNSDTAKSIGKLQPKKVEFK